MTENSTMKLMDSMESHWWVHYTARLHRPSLHAVSCILHWNVVNLEVPTAHSDNGSDSGEWVWLCCELDSSYFCCSAQKEAPKGSGWAMPYIQRRFLGHLKHFRQPVLLSGIIDQRSILVANTTFL